MESEHLITFGTFAALTWSFGATLALCRIDVRRPLRPLLYAAASWAAVCGMLWLDSCVSLGRNSSVYVFQMLTGADLPHLAAAALGFCVGFGPAIWPWHRDWNQANGGMVAKLRFLILLLVHAACFVLLGVITLQEQIKPYLVDRGLRSIITSPGGTEHELGFDLEVYYECTDHPLRIAVGPDGNVYATALRGAALQRGVVVRIAPDPETGTLTETQVARNLNRPFGIAFHDGDLYVSRSGQHSRANHGTLVETNTGAVTLLRDLDGDGIMDYYHDVLSDLPGAQGPDPLHQNNGITFGADGSLYVTVGSHGDRIPAVGPYDGTIIRSRPDGSQTTVFARGFRNPFSVAIGPNGELFCTDNDASDRRNGDELNHVLEGEHYGFPYADGRAEHPSGAVPPLFTVKDGTLQGIAFATSSQLPDDCRNCLYVVNYPNGEIYRIRLTAENGSYRAESSLFARVPQALDIAVDANGTFYISCFESKKIYRLTFRG